MKRALLILLLLYFLSPRLQPLMAQKITLVGSNICSDGTQSVSIGLSDSDPKKVYALYRDDQMIQVRSINTETSPNPLNFGNMSQPGTYTVSEFAGGSNDYSKASSGKIIKGSVSIFGIPVLTVPKKLEIKSGSAISFQPKADKEGCIYNWTARIDKGKVKGFKKTGEGMITDKPELEGSEPACIIYSITPMRSSREGACVGNTVDLIVWIMP